MTVTDLDIDLDAAVDLEKELPCDTEDCNKSAEYRCRIACCGERTLICGACLTEIKVWLTLMEGRRVRCILCGWKGDCSPEWFIVMGRI